MLYEQTKKTLPTSPSIKKYLDYCAEEVKVHAPVSFYSQRRIHQMALDSAPPRLAPISARYACMECSPSVHRGAMKYLWSGIREQRYSVRFLFCLVVVAGKGLVVVWCF